MNTKTENIIASLSYLSTFILLFVVPLLFLIIFNKNKFVKFHSLQALLLIVIYLLVGTGITIIYLYFGLYLMYSIPPLLDNAFYCFLVVWFIVYVILCIVGAYKASKGEKFKFPIIGNIVEKLSNY
ncbi:MAG: DUF4870 domain-containing protein [Methanococci archaeon]|nr:DUF4870 domain-containing protein [Methanococci archaeon]